MAYWNRVSISHSQSSLQYVLMPVLDRNNPICHMDIYCFKIDSNLVLSLIWGFPTSSSCRFICSDFKSPHKFCHPGTYPTRYSILDLFSLTLLTNYEVIHSEALLTPQSHISCPNIRLINLFSTMCHVSE